MDRVISRETEKIAPQRHHILPRRPCPADCVRMHHSRAVDTTCALAGVYGET